MVVARARRAPLTARDDLPWNLASGKVLVPMRGIPAHDMLGDTHGTLRYVEVLGDVGLFAIDRAFGPVRSPRRRDLPRGALATRQDPEGARAAFFEACGAMATRDQGRFERALGPVEVLAPRSWLARSLGDGWSRARR